MEDVLIKTERLKIKKLKINYLEDLRQLRNDPSVNIFLTTTVYITKKMQKTWFQKLKNDSSRMYLTIHLMDGTFIGVIRSDQWDKVNQSIRIGMDIMKKYRRQGFAKEAYRAYLKYLFGKLKMHRVWLEVLDFNTIAYSLYNKLGFRKEGILREAVRRNNQYYNYIVMSLLKKEYDSFI